MVSVKKNFFYNTVYQVLIFILPLITTPYISRILGAEGIGVYSYSFSIANYFVMFAMLGLNNYGNRTIAMVRDDKEKLAKTFFSIYFIQVVSAVIIIILYIFYCCFIDNDIVCWLQLFFVISCLFDINWLFFGLEKFKLTVTRNVIIKLLTVICIFIFIKAKTDLYMYIVLLSFGTLLSQILLWPFVLRNIDIKQLKFISFNDIVKHIKPNLVLFLPVIAVSIYKTMDKVMLGYLVSMHEVGLYENSEKMINIPMALITSLGTVMLPRMSNVLIGNRKTESKKLIYKSIIFVLFLSSSMCFGIMGISKEFVPWFYGDGFSKCIYLLLILLPSCIFLAFANVIRTQYLIPLKKDKIYIISVFLGAIINFVINLFLITKLKSIGVSIGTLFAEIIVCIYQAYAVRYELPIKKYIMDGLKFIIAGFIMFIIIFNLKLFESLFINMLFKIIIGIFIYFIVLCFLVKIEKKTKEKRGNIKT